MNPFVPTSLDGALMAVSVGALLLALAAVISLLLSGAAPSWRPLAWASRSSVRPRGSSPAVVNGRPRAVEGDPATRAA